MCEFQGIYLKNKLFIANIKIYNAENIVLVLFCRPPAAPPIDLSCKFRRIAPGCQTDSDCKTTGTDCL